MKYLGKITDNKDLVTKEYVDTADSSKQDTLVSGTNIKTINNNSLLGSGNITIQGGGGATEFYVNADNGSGTQVLGGEMYFNGDGYIETTATDSGGDSEIGFACNMTSFLNFFYPIGSYYETSNTTFNPNTAWGGTWVEDTAGYVTVAQDTTQTEFDTIGETGGDKHIQDHAHGFTQPKIPNHQHQLQRQQLATATSGSNRWFASGSTVGGNTANDGGGGSCTGGSVGNVQTTSHGTMTTGNSGNLQPYIVVKRWHRTA